MRDNSKYPHVFQPLTIRSVTIKNRLQYAPTVVLKCSPEGEVMQAMEDKSVTVVDMLPIEQFCSEMPFFNRIDLMDRLEKHQVKLVGGQTIARFSDSGVETTDANANEQVYPADTYVLALGVVPDNRLADKIRSRYATDVYVVGDCVSKNRNFFHANQEAYHAAMNI